MKNGIINEFYTPKIMIFLILSGCLAWVRLGPPSIVPRGNPPKRARFSTPIKNETGTNISFYKKIATKEKTMSPPTPPSGL